MNIFCIRHVDFETRGVIPERACRREFNFEIIKPYEGQAFPSLEDDDFVISMGDPQSPREAKKLP